MPTRFRQIIASLALLALCGLSGTGSAADKYKIVNEGGVREDWAAADGAKFNAPGYPAAFASRGDDVCLAMGYCDQGRWRPPLISRSSRPGPVRAAKMNPRRFLAGIRTGWRRGAGRLEVQAAGHRWRRADLYGRHLDVPGQGRRVVGRFAQQLQGHRPADRGAAETGGQVHAWKRQAADGFHGAASATAAATRQYANPPQMRASLAGHASPGGISHSVEKLAGRLRFPSRQSMQRDRREMDDEIDHVRNRPAVRG